MKKFEHAENFLHINAILIIYQLSGTTTTKMTTQGLKINKGQFMATTNAIYLPS